MAPHSGKFARNWEIIRKKREKIGEKRKIKKKKDKLGRFFFFPLLTDRAGYTTGEAALS